MLKETKMFDVDARFMSVAYGFSPERSDVIIESIIERDLSEQDLFVATLTKETNDTKGKLQKGIKQTIARIAVGSTKEIQGLFEQAFTLGSQSNLTYDVQQKFKKAGAPAFNRSVRPLFETSADDKLTLPEDTTSAIVSSVKYSGLRLAKEVYLAGYTAGLFLNSGDEVRLPESLSQGDGSLDQSISILSQLKAEFEQQYLQDPSRIIDFIVPPATDITSQDQLDKSIGKLQYLLTEYTTTRVNTIKDTKKKVRMSVKQGDGRIVVDDWSVNYEDPFFEQAREIVTKANGDQPVTNKEVASVATKLGYLELTKQLLTEDILKGRPRPEVEQLVMLFFVEQADKLDMTDLGNDEVTAQFGQFLEFQYQGYTETQAVEAQMKETIYWKRSGRRQTVTPDTYQITEGQEQSIRDISFSYIDYFRSVTELYNEAVLAAPDSPESQRLVTMLEAGLPTEVIPVCRRLMALGGEIDSLRFDLVPDQDNNFWVAEAQIISGGIPPAALYRKAFEQAGIDLSQVIGRGVLPAFVDRVRSTGAENPMVVGLYSERPYSSDMSKSTSLAGNDSFMQELQLQGIKATSAFPGEVERNGTAVFHVKNETDTSPVTTFYNRVDYVSPTAINTLQNPNMLAILDAVADGTVDMFPRPLPILFGKGVYALIHEKDFEPLLTQKLGAEKLQQLRNCTPESYWIYPENNSINFDTLDPKEWVRKGSYAHATMGMVIGDENEQEFTGAVELDLQSPFSATIQRLVESATPIFRIPKVVRGFDVDSMRMVAYPYRLRVEPTVIDGELCDIFVTGNQDRIVHGRESSIMTLTSVAK